MPAHNTLLTIIFGVAFTLIGALVYVVWWMLDRRLRERLLGRKSEVNSAFNAARTRWVQEHADASLGDMLGAMYDRMTVIQNLQAKRAGRTALAQTVFFVALGISIPLLLTNLTH